MILPNGETPTSQTDELPPEQLENEALQLITDFQIVLGNIPEFQSALVKFYFGRNLDGLINPQDDVFVSFRKDGNWWEVRSLILTDSQKLSLSISNPLNQDYREISLNLIAKRAAEQSNIPSKIIIVGFQESPKVPVHKNTASAVAKAKQLLQFCKK